MLRSSKPVVAVCAVRTGCGKSADHPDVARLLQAWASGSWPCATPCRTAIWSADVQRFAAYADLDEHRLHHRGTEEYEPHIDRGVVVYAGVDYEAILRQAEPEADVILWDGGNNDLPFYRPDLHIVVADPHRPGPRAGLLSGRGQLPHGRRDRHQQGGHGRPGAHRAVRATSRPSTRRRSIVEAASPIFVPTRARSAASACWWSRTARR